MTATFSQSRESGWVRGIWPGELVYLLDGRGVALGDFDNDGLLDIYQTNADQPSLLYHNVSDRPGHWVTLQLIGTRSNRDAIGARATLTAGGTRQMREISGGDGYSAQSSYRLHFGIGSADKIDELRIHWPSGREETVSVPLDRVSYVREGSGVVDVSAIRKP